MNAKVERIQPSSGDGQRNLAQLVDELELVRLAEMPQLEYGRERSESAARLGVPVTILDRAVAQMRSEGTGEAGAPFRELKPWSEAVDGATLLDSLAAIARRHVVLPRHADIAIALFVIATHAIDAMNVMAILAIVSPEMRCGKSTLLAILSRLVRRPLPSSNITKAALFRAVEAWTPTLMIDEADTFLRDSEELRGILNSGHTREAAYVIRTVGDYHEPRRFSTWGAKAIALIGRLPETLHDRSIEIALTRRLPGERVEKLRHADPVEFSILAAKCARWATDNEQAIRAARPTLPDVMNDRAGDNWEGLFAIADIAGGEWPALSRSAAAALSAGADVDAGSIKVQMLHDTAGIFERMSIEKIASADMVTELTGIADSPWADYSRGRPITQRQVARLLRGYGIVPTSVRLPDGRTPKGYRREQFLDAVRRYLPVDPQLRHEAEGTGEAAKFVSATQSGQLRIDKASEMATGGACGAVAVPDAHTVRRRVEV